MRRGAPTPHDSVGPRPTYGTTTTPRSQRSTATTPRSQRSGSAGHGTILVNLDGAFGLPRVTRVVSD
ncbi:hypothetical protein P3T76_011806 [Phytophthora citrophthora]|uniref:Uncharacterized protein n=1 Tax=Phytophthora citrophthora TaxID=4793 RepID=A0AAD9LFH7_9STRA|nr:hypothetical protein P3T76_011806 [Phytophthora citrophthora]